MKHPLVYVDLPNKEYHKLINNSLKYALLSLPFTFDRLSLHKGKSALNATNSRILNILKGKLAEAIFEYFCLINSLRVDFDTPKTPYFQTDKRDFYFEDTEIDIKNNFVYHTGDFYSNYLQLPALIPNRFKNDQWEKRLKKYDKPHVAHIFSFMKAADLHNHKRGKSFIELNLSHQQLQLIYNYFLKYKGQKQATAAFQKEDYLRAILGQQSLAELYSINFYPKLVIAGMANEKHWPLFKNTGPNEADNFMQQPMANWHLKVGAKKSLSFLNGSIWCTITNKTLPVSLLSPITELFPILKNRVVGGDWVNY